MRERISKKTKYLTVSAMLAALGVLILAIGSFFEVLDISVAVIASLLAVYAVIEIGGAYPWLIWLVTSVLSLLLLPQKTPAIFYAVFLGYYPILKEKLEKLRTWLSLVCKLVSFHLALGLIVLILRLFLPSQLEMGGLSWMPILLYVASLVCFLVYDVALTRLITYYLLRLRNRFRIR